MLSLRFCRRCLPEIGLRRPFRAVFFFLVFSSPLCLFARYAWVPGLGCPARFWPQFVSAVFFFLLFFACFVGCFLFLGVCVLFLRWPRCVFASAAVFLFPALFPSVPLCRGPSALFVVLGPSYFVGWFGARRKKVSAESSGAGCPFWFVLFSFCSSSRLGHLKLVGRTCYDALSELVCRSTGGDVFPDCSYCCESFQQQQQQKEWFHLLRPQHMKFDGNGHSLCGNHELFRDMSLLSVFQSTYITVCSGKLPCLFK